MTKWWVEWETNESSKAYMYDFLDDSRERDTTNEARIFCKPIDFEDDKKTA